MSKENKNNRKITVGVKSYPIPYVCKKIRETLGLNSAVHQLGEVFMCDGDVVAIYSKNNITLVTTGRQLAMSKREAILTEIKGMQTLPDGFIEANKFDETVQDELSSKDDGNIYALGHGKKDDYIMLVFLDPGHNVLSTATAKSSVDSMAEYLPRFFRKNHAPTFMIPSEEIAFAMDDMMGHDQRIINKQHRKARIPELPIRFEESRHVCSIILDANERIVEIEEERITGCDLIANAHISDGFAYAFADIISDETDCAISDYSSDHDVGVTVPKHDGMQTEVIPDGFNAGRTVSDLALTTGGKRSRATTQRSIKKPMPNKNVIEVIRDLGAVDEKTVKRTTSKRKAVNVHDSIRFDATKIGKIRHLQNGHKLSPATRNLVEAGKKIANTWHQHEDGAHRCNECAYEDHNDDLKATSNMFRGMSPENLTRLAKDIESAVTNWPSQVTREPIELKIARTILNASNSTKCVHGNHHTDRAISEARNLVEQWHVHDGKESYCNRCAYDEPSDADIESTMNMLRNIDSTRLADFIRTAETCLEDYGHNGGYVPIELGIARTLSRSTIPC